MLMLVDVADPRYGGAPDPDDERRKRWQPIERRISLPFLGSLGCLIAASSGTSDGLTYGLTATALAFSFAGARAAWPRACASDEPDRGTDRGTDPADGEEDRLD